MRAAGHAEMAEAAYFELEQLLAAAAARHEHEPGQAGETTTEEDEDG